MQGIRISRRHVLTSLGVAGVGTVSGCASDDEPGTAADGTGATGTTAGEGTDTGASTVGGGEDQETSTEDDPPDLGSDYWSFETGGPVYSSPTVVDGTLYVGSHDRNLYALNAETGEERWRFRTGPNPNVKSAFGMKGYGIRSSPQVVGGTVYVGSNDYNVYAVDAETGEEQWRLETDSYVYSSPTVVDDIVYVGSRGGGMYALDAATGESVWEAEVGTSGTAPLVVDGKVFMGSYTLDKTVSCFDAATGEALWRRGEGLETCSSPTYHRGLVLNGSLDEYVYALDPDTGETVWKTNIDGPQNNASFTAKDGTLYASRYRGGLVALDVETGDVLWEAETFSAGNQAPTTVGDAVVAVNQASGITVVDAATGDVRWGTSVYDGGGYDMVSSPLVVDGVLFLGTDKDNTLHAMEIGLEGSSDGSRVRHGMKNHHHEWAEMPAQDLDVRSTGHSVAANVEAIRVEEDDDGDESDVGWLDDVPNYEGTVDLRGRGEVTIAVGAGEMGHQFDPAAILVDVGTTVVWEWTGAGGAHNVVELRADFESELTDEEGHTVRRTFDEERVVPYYCEPHRDAGMKGVVAVGRTDDELVEPEDG